MIDCDDIKKNRNICGNKTLEEIGLAKGEKLVKFICI